MIRRLVSAATMLVAVFAFYIIAPSAGLDDAARAGAFGRDRDVAAANAQVRALGDTLRAVTAALARARVWETARGLAADPAARKVIVRPGLEPAAVRVFERVAREEMAAFERPRIALRVVVVPEPQPIGSYRRYTVIPDNPNQPCVVVVAVAERARSLRVAEGSRLLGACGFYSRFGYPGSGMQEWLRASRGIAAAVDTVLAVPQRQPLREKLKGAQIGQVPAAAACLAGIEAGCAQVILDPFGISEVTQIVPPSERTGGVFVSFGGSSVSDEGQTLAAIREQVGDARFQAIWSSAQDPAEAYKTATGEHIAVFARPMLLRVAYPHRPGPLRAGLPLFLGLGIGLTAAAWAITRTGRERSGA